MKKLYNEKKKPSNNNNVEDIRWSRGMKAAKKRKIAATTTHTHRTYYTYTITESHEHTSQAPKKQTRALCIFISSIQQRTDYKIGK